MHSGHWAIRKNRNRCGLFRDSRGGRSVGSSTARHGFRCSHDVFHLRRQGVAAHAHYPVVLEQHMEAFHLGGYAVLAIMEYIIPTVLVEHIHQQRRAQDKAGLGAGHADFQPVNLVGRNGIALGDIELVGGEIAAASQAQQQNQKKAAHCRDSSACGQQKKGRMIAEFIPLPHSIHQGIIMSKASDLQGAGLKATGPRLKILSLFEKSAQRHMTAEDVYKLLLDEDEDVGLATVYRVLTQFEQAGLLVRHHFESGKAVFELNHGGHHDHLVCIKCGKVEEFYDPDIEARQDAIAQRSGFLIQDHVLYLYGICTACQQRPGGKAR